MEVVCKRFDYRGPFIKDTHQKAHIVLLYDQSIYPAEKIKITEENIINNYRKSVF